MGNHMVGQLLAAAAKGFWFNKEDDRTTEEALEFLDSVAIDWEGSDAEFDDELMDADSTDLARLVALAMDATDEEMESEEDEDGNNPWNDGPVKRFRDRYNFK